MSLTVGTLWRHADFNRLWFGESVSLLGTQVTTLALPLTAVVLLGATPAQMGLLGAAEYLPFLVVTLFAGVWIDRHRRRSVLISANLVRALLLGLIPILAILGQLQMIYLVLIALATGIFTVFFQLAYEAYLPRLLEPGELVEGNSKLSVSASVAEIGGPGLAGLLVQLITAPLAILVDAASFLVAACSLVFIRRPEASFSPPSGQDEHLWRAIAEGLRLTLRNGYLRAFAGEAAVYNFFWQIMRTILVLYAIRVLHLSPGFLGLIIALGSVGALGGALLTPWLAARLGTGRTMIVAQAASDLSIFLVPLTALAGLTAIAPALLIGAFFLAGAGNTACNVHVNSLRQAVVPDHLRGRTNAVYRLLVNGVVALGALLGGWLGERFGLEATLLIGSLGVSTSWLWLLFSPIPSLRSLAMLKQEQVTLDSNDPA